MTLISFEDAVTAANLDPNQTHAVYYADGLYANHWAVARQCPRAKLYGITVRGLTGPGIFAVDCEIGDLDVPATLRWVERQMLLKVDLICVYANLSRFLNEGLLAGIVALEKKYGVRVKKWLAHYTGNPVLEFSWVDAEQYADPGPIDRNVALANFFGDATPAPAPVPPKPPTTFNQGFNAGFQRGFAVGWCRRHHKPLPAYVRQAGQAVAYNLGFRAGFVKGWLA